MSDRRALLAQGTKVRLDGERDAVIERWGGGNDYIVRTTTKTGEKVRLAVDGKRLAPIDDKQASRPDAVTK